MITRLNKKIYISILKFIKYLLTNINYRAKIKIVVSKVQQIILLFILYFIFKKLKNSFNFFDF